MEAVAAGREAAMLPDGVGGWPKEIKVVNLQ